MLLRMKCQTTSVLQVELMSQNKFQNKLQHVKLEIAVTTHDNVMEKE